jgi:RNA polymerase sigma-70 factor (ECF subfamily)
VRAIASRHIAREWRAGSVQTTALVNEACMKLVDQRQADRQNRAQFFAIAAQAVALDRALDRPYRLDRGHANVVELRFFAGMTVEETAAVLDVSPGTVKREGALANARLDDELTTGTGQGGPR